MQMAPPRMKVADRRQQVLEAAMHEFGRAGFDTVSVSEIARRAGVSQPYVFQLFGTKKDLYVATIEQRSRQILDTFRTAAAANTDKPLEAMGLAYVALLEDDPDALRCQLNAWAASSDPVIGDAARSAYLSIWRAALELSGADPETVRDFMAQGMLCTVIAALDLKDAYDAPDLHLFDDGRE